MRRMRRDREDGNTVGRRHPWISVAGAPCSGTMLAVVMTIHETDDLDTDRR